MFSRSCLLVTVLAANTAAADPLRLPQARPDGALKLERGDRGRLVIDGVVTSASPPHAPAAYVVDPGRWIIVAGKTDAAVWMWERPARRLTSLGTFHVHTVGADALALVSRRPDGWAVVDVDPTGPRVRTLHVTPGEPRIAGLHRGALLLHAGELELTWVTPGAVARKTFAVGGDVSVPDDAVRGDRLLLARGDRVAVVDLTSGGVRTLDGRLRTTTSPLICADGVIKCPPVWISDAPVKPRFVGSCRTWVSEVGEKIIPSP